MLNFKKVYVWLVFFLVITSYHIYMKKSKHHSELCNLKYRAQN